ncbi:LysR family transcriptional regulator [Burkholderia sp. Bp9002]|nr:LysR family transcriptional regulator [Burkholderia sp. Bp9002]
MTPDQLITFAAVAEHLNISRAALALHLSQPAVSGQLRLLQDEFGEPLYQRDGRGIRLTPIGEQLSHYATSLRDTYAQARAFRDAVRGLEAGTLRIGASTTPASYLLPYLIAAFQPTAPRVAIQTMSGNTAEVVAALPSLDIALIEGPPGEALPPGTAAHRWHEDEIVAIMPAGHPLAARAGGGDQGGDGGVTLDALAAHPLVLREAGSGVRQLVERAFASAGAPMRVALEIAGVEAVKEAVRAGMGIGFVSAMSVRHDDAALAMRSLAPAPLTRHFSILVPHGAAPSRLAAQFLAMSLAQTLG